MLNKRIIPCLLLRDNLFVKTIKFDTPSHISEPIYAIKIFNDYEVDEILILDIMASRYGTTPTQQGSGKLPLELISKISDEACMPISYGGGIKTIEDMEMLFRAGVEKVSINTHAITNPEIIQMAAKEFGSQSIVVSIDIKKENNEGYHVYSHCGSRKTNLDPIEYARSLKKMGAGELIINSIDRDGTMLGYDIPLIKQISSSVSVPIIALGGAGTMQDFSHALHEGGASAVAAGSMFVYFGKKRAVLINYPDRQEIDDIIK